METSKNIQQQSRYVAHLRLLRFESGHYRIPVADATTWSRYQRLAERHGEFWRYIDTWGAVRMYYSTCPMSIVWNSRGSRFFGGLCYGWNSINALTEFAHEDAPALPGGNAGVIKCLWMCGIASYFQLQMMTKENALKKLLLKKGSDPGTGPPSFPGPLLWLSLSSR